MRKLSQIWFEVQEVLFPFVEKQVEEPITEKLKHLVTTLELIRVEDMIRAPGYWAWPITKIQEADSKGIHGKGRL
ncbi:MAG: hypothetical protein GY699_14300 [Desulfobacteraceae bacterium]|nr:hypothetical protein [Desulfobacteraceae bacterium]